MEQQDNIRYETIDDVGYNTQHVFTFLNNGDDDPRVRWEQLVDFSRRILGPMGWRHYGVTLHPADETNSHPRQIVFRNLFNVTADTYISIYEAMQTSQTSVVLPGFRVIFENLGADLPTRGGWGTPLGYKCIEAHIRTKYKGIAEHPDLVRQLQARPELADRLKRNCGPRALLLAKDKVTYVRDFDRWLDDADRLAEDMLMVGGCMELHHVKNLVTLPGWTHLRVLLLNEFGVSCRKSPMAYGEDWAWSEGVAKDDVDPNTLHIFHSTLYKHYWWVQFPTTFANQYRNHMAEWTLCWCCVQNRRKDQLSSHICAPVGILQCPICLGCYSDQQSLDDHLARRSDSWKCHVCERTTFNGADCFRRHQDHNCQPVRLPLRPSQIPTTRVVCPSCDSYYLCDVEHDCHDFGGCRSCAITFRSAEERSTHRCTLAPTRDFWQPVTYRKPRKDGGRSYVWNAHWFYDFETYRAERMHPTEGDTFAAYKHGVMAWCLQLMLPCATTRNFVRDEGIVDSIVDLAYRLRRTTDTDVQDARVGDTVRLWGRDLEGFLVVTREICAFAEPKLCTWKPTFWAHNGSKFDVKFVFDYYATVQQLELAARDYFPKREPRSKDDQVEWVWTQRKVDRQAMQAVAIGSKILSLIVAKGKFKCSHVHHAAPLRDLPAIFGLPPDLAKKGEFPYGRLRLENWGSVHANGLPPLEEYDINKMVPKRRADVIIWWLEEQARRNVNPSTFGPALAAAGVTRDELTGFLLKAPLHLYDPDRPPIPWVFDDELWSYLFADVQVGASAMEAYHRSAEDMHAEIWRDLPPHLAELRGKLVSPLDSSTSPSWALQMYRTWFMPTDTLYTLTQPEAAFIRGSLRGGRTDKRANYMKLLAPGDRIGYFDFKSLYPSVQKCQVHDTHFPVGVPVPATWGDRVASNADLLREMAHCGKTGFLEVDTRCLRYTTHPTLHRLQETHAADRESQDEDPEAEGKTPKDRSKKLVFANSDVTQEVYAWPELEEAIRCGEIEVTRVHRGYLFDKGTDVFERYVDFFFKLKEFAERTKNKGLRALAKLLLNSLWGKLGQRPYGVREWVRSPARLDYLYEQFEQGALELISFKQCDPTRIWIEYRPVTDYNNLESTLPQVAAYVSMWGRVILHKKVLSVFGQQALYCDTDSAVIYMHPGDETRLQGVLGSELGDLVDEVPKLLEDAGYDVKNVYTRPYIAEAVFLAPKTYALRVVNDDPYLSYTKAVHKGFEPSYENARSICFKSMKALIWTQCPEIPNCLRKRGLLTEEEEQMPAKRVLVEKGKMLFKSSVATNRAVPVETWTQKVLTGRYTKGLTHPHNPMLVQPFGDFEPPQTTFADEDASPHPNLYYP